jgi:hypothetical protein
MRWVFTESFPEKRLTKIDKRERYDVDFGGV